MIDVRARLRYEVTNDTTFVFSIEAAESERQRLVSEQLRVGDVDAPRQLTDPAGNRLIVVTVEPGEVVVDYAARVDLDPFVPPHDPTIESEFDELPGDVYEFLRPSRYCESDQLTRLAERLFGAQSRGIARVQDVCDWVHGHLDYVSGSTDSSSTALDVFHAAAGVCRDFSHLSIAMCRATGIPARYVSGYAVDLDPPDFHGFFEAFIDGRWYLFDATQMSSIDQLVRIATGRDAADTAFATFVGTAVLLELDVEATVPGDDVEQPEPTTVSTA